jgi:hypothetical protein
MRGKCVSGRTVRLLTLLIVAVCGSASAAAAQTTYSAVWDANTDPHTVGYRVFGGVASGAYTWSVDVGNATTAALPPLSPGSSYYFVVRAYNAAGELGPASNEASLDLGGPPSMPRGVSAGSSGSFVTLSWSPPVGGSPVTHYLLYVGTAPGASDLVNGVPVGNVLSVSGTVVPNRYYARVQAVNSYGVGPTSSEISFVVGGPDGDCGLTGRKIIVDTYGGYAPHGGGAFSGKDPTKVDRSAAYAARYLAKNVVAAGLADRCLIQVAYAIGVADPMSLYVDTQGTGKVDERKLEKVLADIFPLRPTNIRRSLQLNKPIYQRTAAYGHFGRKPDKDGGFSWERTDLAAELKRAFGAR